MIRNVQQQHLNRTTSRLSTTQSQRHLISSTLANRNQAMTVNLNNNKPTTSSSQRLNEPLNTGRKSRQNASRSLSRGLLKTGDKRFVVEQADREVWVNEYINIILIKFEKKNLILLKYLDFFQILSRFFFNIN